MLKNAISLFITLLQLSLFSPPARSAGFTLEAVSATEVPLLSPLREPPAASA